MRVVIIYRAESDYARAVIDFLRDLKRQAEYALEELDPDTAEGAGLCRVYDIVEYPSIVALGADGALQNLWRGLPLPTVNEVGYYVGLD